MKLKPMQILTQIRANAVAIVSVIVALTGMAYNTYRTEKTEINHGVRIAAFETLKNLGEAQIGVEYAHHDLAQVLPAPGPADAERLLTAWRENVDKLEDDNDAMVKITDEIQLLRLDTLEILGRLH